MTSEDWNARRVSPLMAALLGTGDFPPAADAQAADDTDWTALL